MKKALIYTGTALALSLATSPPSHAEQANNNPNSVVEITLGNTRDTQDKISKGQSVVWNTARHPR